MKYSPSNPDYTPNDIGPAPSVGNPVMTDEERETELIKMQEYEAEGNELIF